MKQDENQQPTPSGANGHDTGNGKAGEPNNILTTRQGHPVVDNQNIRTVGNRGPATMENYQFLEKMSHFDRERVPERVVHAQRVGPRRPRRT